MFTFLLTVLQVIVVSLHYLLAYSYSFIITGMETLGLKISSVPAGQLVMSSVETMLKLIGEAAMWSTKESSRSTSWALFLPLLITVHWTRLVVSAVLYVLLGTTLSPKDITRAIEPVREYVQDLLTRGQALMEEKEEAMSEVDLEEFFLYRLTRMCVLRPVARFSRTSLYFFGLLPAIKPLEEMSKEANANDTEKRERFEENQQNQHENHHHEY